MTISIVKNQIFNFLSTETPEVMAIKGEWGVGKTYSWKKYLEEAKDKNIIQLERYSYVSLFGINSLDAFKYSIFENVIKRDIIGTEASIETFKSNATGLAESFGRQSLNFLKGAPVVKNLTPTIEAISFLSLTKTLICIDDLERKGGKLDIKDVLGLVSLLKEQKQCKIVILLNDGEEGLEEFVKYREKVIDIELVFEPSAKECAAIAYAKPTIYSERLSKHVTHLGIRNIRVLKKIERLVELAIPIAEGYEPEILDQVIHSIVLYSWCYYTSESNQSIPSLEYVTGKGYNILGLMDDEKESEEEKQWKSILQGYNYQLTDELDLVLANSVIAGYINEIDFKRRALEKNKEIVASKSESSFSEAWRLYHDTFDDNRDEVIDTIFDSFHTNVEYISPSGLNGTVSLFRKLSQNEKASKLIDFYIEKRSNETEIFNTEELRIWGDVIDNEIIDKFSKKYSTDARVEKSPKEILLDVAEKSGWNQKDLVVLESTSVEEYYKIFKETNGRPLSRIISAALKFGQFVNASDQQKEIARLVTEALKKIGKENELNKIRVKKFGVDI